MSRADDEALIRSVLAGHVTRDNSPWVFEEDELLFAVARLEKTDPAWLVAALTDRSHPLPGRRAVLAETCGVREQVLAALRPECADPDG